MIEIKLSGKPISVNALYTGRRFLTKKGRETKEDHAWEAKSQYRGAPLKDNLSMEVFFYFADNRRHDIDGCLKATLDSLTGIAYEDDSQIIHLVVEKHLNAPEDKTVVNIYE